jgi:hypothetical protein
MSVCIHLHTRTWYISCPSRPPYVKDWLSVNWIFLCFMKCELCVTLIKGSLAGANVGNFLGFVTTPSVAVLLLGSVYVLVTLTRWMDIWWRQTLHGARGAFTASGVSYYNPKFWYRREEGLPRYSPHSKVEFKKTDFLDTIISNFTWLKLHPKSATDIGWLLVLFIWHNSPQWARVSFFTRLSRSHTTTRHSR